MCNDEMMQAVKKSMVECVKNKEYGSVWGKNCETKLLWKEESGKWTVWKEDA